jgi:hypothetical protein
MERNVEMFCAFSSLSNFQGEKIARKERLIRNWDFVV